MKGYLFIGGPLDGEWKAIQGSPSKHEAPAVLDHRPLLFSGDPPQFDRVTYRREAFHVEGGSEVILYIDERLTLWDATVRLFQNYRPEKGEDPR